MNSQRPEIGESPTKPQFASSIRPNSLIVSRKRKEYLSSVRGIIPENRRHLEEEQAVDAAMCSLHVLHSTLKASAIAQPTRSFDYLKAARGLLQSCEPEGGL